jgi:hypothetical protein
VANKQEQRLYSTCVIASEIRVKFEKVKTLEGNSLQISGLLMIQSHLSLVSSTLQVFENHSS